jgi:SAM-dependent methyltransferase
MSKPDGSTATAAFDQCAADYDATFTDTGLGRLLRARVWAHVDPLVRPGTRVLELNCGTGEDAVHLAELGAHVLATDAAAEMVAITRAKAGRHGVGERVAAATVAIESLDVLDVLDIDPTDAPFDLVLSDFGGINCLADVRPLGPVLARLVRPGGSVVLVVMGPVVPWEWAWYLAHRQPRRAVRRLRRSTEWRGMTIRYPSHRSLTRAFAAHFERVAVVPIGAALPPSYVEPWIRERQRLLRHLTQWEDRLVRVPGAASLADHYLLHLRRR